ncbi:hypothetical protein CAter282_2079 [Collimonas arenae]|uniref:Uncharacterized protein n=1 Tax=Collimonas arenae TaxID=279058 RepID=A0A127QIH0_9BURK|nr:hypothetical protein [Collimonas arenae]AMO99942.1 hypothetical protein CAter10_2259 [Collimonas arenae]AMP09837.1 hypothetical protein CAter282_2079 [Collimonas arenae]
MTTLVAGPSLTASGDLSFTAGLADGRKQQFQMSKAVLYEYFGAKDGSATELICAFGYGVDRILDVAESKHCRDTDGLILIECSDFQ